MLDSIRRRLMMKFAENKEIFRSWNLIFCLTFEKKLAVNMESFRTMKLIRSSDIVFEVLSLDQNFRVDLSWLFCSCNLWQIQGFPCSYDVASISNIGESLYDYYNQFFLAFIFRLSYNWFMQSILTSLMIMRSLIIQQYYHLMLNVP